MLYEIIKVTVIDSVHEEKVAYCKINASDEDIRLVIIPELNKLVDSINMNYKFIQSVKRVHFVIKLIDMLNINSAIDQINLDIKSNIVSYNANVNIANRRSKVLNKRNKDNSDLPLHKTIDKKDFNNPFVNYNIVYADAKTGDYIALGKE